MESLRIDNTGKLIISGMQQANGVLKISGAKNSVLPIMAACILTDEKIILRNVPNISDVSTMIEILESSGKTVTRVEDTLYIEKSEKVNSEIPYEPVRKMRASFNVFGPLTVRNKLSKVALPGGCSLGARPVNFHIDGLMKLGVESKIEHGFVYGKMTSIEKDEVHISLDFPSVGATEHILTTATLIDGVKTIINNCAMEPEIDDLANFLNKMGANIEGIGTSKIVVHGVKNLHGIDYTVIPDRIEAGTFIIMGALIGKDLTIKNINAEHLESLFSKLDEMNIEYELKESEVKLSSSLNKKLNATIIDTAPYPGFPTDLQSQMMVLCSLIDGRTTIKENIFSNRLSIIDELNRMGANIKAENNNLAIIDGVKNLSGAPVQATDLRSAAALLLAALVAEGETIINNVDHIFRGYEKLEEKLKNVGIIIDYYE